MRLLLAAATVLAHSVPSAAYDHARVLLSDHAVICSPGTPVTTVRHLVEDWGALIYVVQSDELWAHAELLPWVGVVLPPWTHTAAATDSLGVWKARLHLDAAVTTDDPELAAVASAAGLRVFTQSGEFRRGGVAIPNGEAYVYYEGPTPTFFSRPGYLEARLAESPVRKDAWTALAGSLAGAFREGSGGAASRWPTLLLATHTADSLAALETAQHPVKPYAERWRHCLAWWLAPAWKADTIALFAGQETEQHIEVRMATTAKSPPGSTGDSTGAQDTISMPSIQLTGIRSVSEDISAEWITSWPVELAGKQPVTLTGTFKSVRSGPRTTTWELNCIFDSFRFTRVLPLAVDAQTALQAAFIPPVVFVDNEHDRAGDPDFTISVASGQLELVNRSESPLTLQLAWRSESPIELSATATDMSLAPGEKKRTGFTLSIPGNLQYKEYGFGAEVTTAAGLKLTVRGQLWREAPRQTGRGALGAAGCTQAWLAALPALGIKAVELVPSAIKPADLAALDAVLIRHGARSPSQSSVNAVSEFVRKGGLAILDLGPDAQAWLPSLVHLIRRPGPFAASFYKEDLDWWQSPNSLVGGCFAAASRDTVYTLTAGESGWSPLLVDDQGKGFMYRYRHGNGWYVLIHAGWSPRLEQLERRAHLGLLNLMSAASR